MSESALPFVLLVEDDEGQRHLIRRSFKADDSLTFRMVEDLAAARLLLAERLPDLMMVDWRLPDGLGIELADGPLDTARYPTVVMTAHGDEYVAVEAMRAGAIDYVVKTTQSLREMPRIAHRVLREWRRVLDHRQAQSARRLRETQLQEYQRRAAVSALAIGAARELQQLLNTVSNELEATQVALASGQPPARSLAQIDLATRRGQHLVDRLLSFGGERPHDEPELIRPAGLARQAIERLVQLTGDSRFVLEAEPNLPWLRADHDALRQALVQLGLNAIEAGAERIVLRCRAVVCDDGSPCVVLEVVDDGPGMPLNVMLRAKEPLFTTKSDGTGLGLTMVGSVAQACEGILQIERHTGPGLTCRLVLPAVEA